MSRLNPGAVALWALFAIIGYLAGGPTYALVGVAVGLTISIIAQLASR